MKRNLGFTLMELLIVIAIIGILVSVSVVSYSSAQKKGRDSRRHGDLKTLQNAWEQFYADNNANYPSSCAFSLIPTPGVMSGTYLPAGFPSDPKSGAVPTPYPGVCSASAYCFCASLEGETNSNADCSGGAAASPYIGVACVRSLQ